MTESRPPAPPADVQLIRTPQRRLGIVPHGYESVWWLAGLFVLLLAWVVRNLITFSPGGGESNAGALVRACLDLAAPLVGIGGAFLLRSASDPTRRRLGIWAMRISGLLLVGVLVFGERINGATRWYPLPYNQSFQPLEFAKLALILAAASYFAPLKQRSPELQARRTAEIALLTLASLVLVALQPNYSGVALFGAMALALAWIGGVPKRLLAVAIIAALVVGATLVMSSPERRQRVQAVFAPASADLDIAEENFQRHQALTAIAQGGWLGQGPGQSTVKYTLPASESDFIFAIIVEEYGILGGLVVIGLLATLILGTLWMSARVEDRYLQFLGFGVALHWGFQTLLNLQVSLGGVTTGVPLIFFSQGGSAMLILGVEMGLIGILAHALDRQPRTAVVRATVAERVRAGAAAQ